MNNKLQEKAEFISDDMIIFIDKASSQDTYPKSTYQGYANTYFCCKIAELLLKIEKLESENFKLNKQNDVF